MITKESNCVQKLLHFNAIVFNNKQEQINATPTMILNTETSKYICSDEKNIRLYVLINFYIFIISSDFVQYVLACLRILHKVMNGDTKILKTTEHVNKKMLRVGRKVIILITFLERVAKVISINCYFVVRTVRKKSEEHL